MPSSKPAKAQIMNLDDRTERPIECLFNPTEYTLDKSNTWNSTVMKQQNAPDLEFGGGGPMKLTMELFFDTYATGEDVRDTTSRIWKLMGIIESKERPPMVRFQWGSMQWFKAVITSITEKFLLFRYDGTPVRATLNVTFLQAKDEGKYPGQNPTTVGQPGYKRRMVREGDTIDWIAFEEYGDSAMWRLVADTNSLDNPSRLKPGQVLTIAPL